MARLRVEVRAGLGLLATGLALCAAVAVVFEVRLDRLNNAVERARASAVGRIERIERGRGATAVVAWTDGRGTAHHQRFPLSDPDRYRPGDGYPVRYDPAAARPSALPAADDDLNDRRDEEQVPLVLAVGAGTVLCLFWAGRTMLHLLTRRGPAGPGRARAGRARTGRTIRPVIHVWWQQTSGPPREGWQPVMPGPAERALRATDGHSDGAAVTVHQLLPRGRIVLVLPDGTSLVPAGRLRSRQPHDWTDTPEPPPLPGTPPPLPRGWQWRCAAAGTAAGVIGALVGRHLTGQTTATVVIALALAAFTAAGMWLRETLHTT